jgi:FlaA1/EpsC-like NDP-sugar epimerase
LSIGFSIYFAFSLRFDLFSVGTYLNQYLDLIYIIIPVKILFFWLAGLYKPVVKYLGLEFFMTALVASIGSTGILVLLSFVFRFHSFPRSVYIIDTLLTLFLIIGSRMTVRWVLLRSVDSSWGESSAEKVLTTGRERSAVNWLTLWTGSRKSRSLGLSMMIRSELKVSITVADWKMKAPQWIYQSAS